MKIRKENRWEKFELEGKKSQSPFHIYIYIIGLIDYKGLKDLKFVKQTSPIFEPEK